MPPKAKLNVHKFPRPPSVERTARHLVIKLNGRVIADTKEGFWVLETTHPPTYYLPRSCLSASIALTQMPNKTSMCEWKGRATYWKLEEKQQDAKQKKGETTTTAVAGKVWTYDSPTQPFAAIKGYLSFYASGVPWECFVDGEKVAPQPGDYYGGWSTSELEGVQKGGPGTLGW